MIADRQDKLMEDSTLTCLGGGWTSTIYLTTDKSKILKVLDRKRAKPLFEHEFTAYKRISERPNRPSSILEFFGSNPDIPNSIVLEHAENGSIWDYIEEFRDLKTPIDRDLLLRWSRQAAQALEFVHTCDIIHGDVHTTNMLLDADFNLKLCDFGACSIDGGRQFMMYRRSHQLWEWDGGGHKWNRTSSVRSEIFALGCVMFNMETCRDIFQDLHDGEDNEEMARRLQLKEMPSVEETPVLGKFISKCWNLGYQSMHDIEQDIIGIQAIV